MSTSYQVSAKPSTDNKDKSGTQKAILDNLLKAFPYAVVTKASSGLIYFTIPNAPAALPPPPPAATTLLFQDDFTYPDGLVTNEYAFWNPTLVDAIKSPLWDMTSGSLFAKGGQGYNGNPDDKAVDALSALGNNSQCFRLTSIKRDFLDFSVAFKLTMVKQISSAQFPAVAWDGIHIFLRYQAETDLYYASVNRRDGKCIIKRKRAGGPNQSNGGTYTELGSYTPYAWMPGIVQNIGASIKNQADGTVLITLSANGTEIMRVVDDGTKGWGGAIKTAGGTGIRGDNSEFLFDDFVVSGI